MKIHLIKIQFIAALVVLPVLSIAAIAQTAQDRLDAAMARAQAAGIPVSLLESKIAEGRAKGIAVDRIAVAVESRLSNLERAKAAMTGSAADVDAAQLSVGADAIGAGVSEAVLKQIAALAARDRRAVAVAALTQLVLHGTAPETAFLRVKEALSRGPQALANLAAQAGEGSGRPTEPAGSRGSSSGAASAPGAGGPPTPMPAPAQNKIPTIPPSTRGSGRR